MAKRLHRLTLAAGFTFTAQAAFAATAPATPSADEAPAAPAAMTSTAATAVLQPGAPAPAVTAAQLVQQVNIPYQSFMLANGLRVIVHEDRKAPIVAVSVWYNVGSKDEPVGRTGFAHLFEHIMFNGSENAPGDYFQYTRQMGATDLNGTTWYDRTNYFETVPRPALERALFLESDRMGHLLGGLTEESVHTQIGVVQNEKRQGDNEPFGLVEYAQAEALFPVGHPYHHTTIGSMADIGAATITTASDWFRAKYGPNNAVLVLAGDINAAEARPLVERYFGDIARGPVNNPAQAPVPTLPRRVDQTMHDRVANTRLYRDWVVPGLTDADIVPLQVGASILGGLASSRLDNALVRGDQTAVSVTAGVQEFHRISQFEVTVDVKPGQNADAVSRKLDQLITQFVTRGPTADEVQRAVMRGLSGTVQGLEQVGGFGGKAVALAEGALYANDPDFYHRRLQQLATVTPAQVRAAMQRWLRRPVYALRVAPGDREAYQEAPGVTGRAAPAAAAGSTKSVSVKYDAVPAEAQAQPPHGTRQMPPIGEPPALNFPAIERAQLSNGVRVVYARRAAVPVTRIAVSFDAGVAADPANRQGTQALMLNLLEEGTTHLNSVQLAEAQERLGASISEGASLDRTVISLTALTPNLAPSLDLLTDIIRNPAFAPAEIERVRQQQLASIASELTQPSGLAVRAMPVVLYGASHPYGKPGSGSGDPAIVANLTRAELTAFHDAWIRPDNATIFAVGDLPLSQLVAELEPRFGTWATPAAPRGTKTFPARGHTRENRIILIDRPQSPQSFILAGQLLDIEGTDDTLALTTANQVLGGDFLARINMELRENKGWSYGAFGTAGQREYQLPYLIQAPVQADRTGESIAAIKEQLTGFLGPNGTTQAERDRTVAGSIGQLPGQFETSPAVLGALQGLTLYHRPDDYYETLPTRLRGMTAASLDQAIRAKIDPSDFVWVVVGDAARIRPQLERLNMPIEDMRLAAPTPAAAPTAARPATGAQRQCSRTVTDNCVQRGGR